MTCEVHNKEINSQCAKLLVHPLYISLENRAANPGGMGDGGIHPPPPPNI